MSHPITTEIMKSIAVRQNTNSAAVEQVINKTTFGKNCKDILDESLPKNKDTRKELSHEEAIAITAVLALLYANNKSNPSSTYDPFFETRVNELQRIIKDLPGETATRIEEQIKEWRSAIIESPEKTSIASKTDTSKTDTNSFTASDRSDDSDPPSFSR